MTDLFTHRDVATIPLTEYISWFLNPQNPQYNQVQLPPIQRNSVWNIAQVERLWDSLLRGFPIGSMLLAPRTADQAARTLTSDQQSTASDAGYFLLDGQQRTRTLLLGFQPTATSRLWIDIDPILVFNNADHNDRRFLLRLLTGHQPWGMRRHNPSERLREHDKHDAREELGNSRRYDYRIFPVPQYDGDLTTSWPIEANTPIPLDALIELCGGWQRLFERPSWEQVRELVPLRFVVPAKAPAHLQLLLDALENLLANGRRQRSIPLLLLPEHATGRSNATLEAENIPDAVEVLFRRVNSSGTVLEGEEMAYSLLKSSWDQAYELVADVINHPKVGYLFPATGVVMAAARLARRQQGYLADLNPSVSQFRRWLGQSVVAGADSTFLDQMKNLLASTKGQGVFTRVLEEFCQLALYNPHSSLSDPGIPRKLLLKLHPILLHPVLSWVHDNLTDTDRLAANRKGILRYLLYLLIVRPDAHRYTRLAGDVLSAQSSGIDFPDQGIYSAWRNEADAPPMPNSGELLSASATQRPDGWLKYPEELFGPSHTTEAQSADPFHSFRSKFWEQTNLLLWFQRAYLNQWFADYNPMRMDSADTPFDYDHILPKSHVLCQGRSLELEEDGEGYNRFDWRRRHYADSIGNLRIWPSWANRSDGNICHTKKLRFQASGPLTCETSTELGLTSPTDYMLASAITPADHHLWQEAGGHPGYWPVARRQAWMQAVEQRTSTLYGELFTTLGFSAWLQAGCQPNNQPTVTIS